jgi:hypothetical protein
MRFQVVAVLAAVVLAGCATVPRPDAEQVYVSILERPATHDGCDFNLQRSRNDGRPGWVGKTRIFPPPADASRSSATWSYAMQVPMERPAVGETRCLIVLRERRSGEAADAGFGFELRALGADRVEIRPRGAMVRNAARRGAAASRVNVSTAFGLADSPAQRRAARVLDQTRIDLGPIATGPAIEVEAAPAVLRWPQTTPSLRVIAVVGERAGGRADPSRRMMAGQAANRSTFYDPWPPAR